MHIVSLAAILPSLLCCSNLSRPPGGGDFSIPDKPNRTSTGLLSPLVTSWVPGTRVTTMNNISTSWYTPIIDPNYTPAVPTFTPNSTLSSLLAERTKYCWITAEDEINGFIPEDLSKNCYSLYEDYCDLGPTDPIPSVSPTAIPGSCTPKQSSFSPTTSSPSATSSVVTTPTPTQPNMAENCVKFHKVIEGDNCASIAKQYGISQNDFLSWNPGVGDNCESLWLDYYVCVGSSPRSTSIAPTSTGLATPTPTQPKMTKNCDNFHKVEDGDNCASIAKQYGISQENFLTWNPGVGDDCTSLWLDYYVCVGSSARSTSLTPTPTSLVTPTPTQSGMSDGCTGFYKIESGDICADIAKQHGISLADFLAWNPDVGDDCASLWLGYYVCVAK